MQLTYLSNVTQLHSICTQRKMLKIFPIRT
ncbi:hypothetical protein Bhyg_11380 [Pseudolycoriella hygida]|uniref:Uncharacterized protein n=1 Tax=Pseudolycoriella hygida TaxID=35572 RepID=A0A9Q0S087_9DIPT|nr:hypothetical protein Bhyg_11380 [Pseudolycoriella hygida]